MSLINFYRENKEQVLESLKKRNLDAEIYGRFEELSNQRIELLKQVEDKRRELNEKTPKGAPDERTKEELRKISDEVSRLSKDLEVVENDLESVIKKLPNLVSPEAPVGEEADFKVLREWGEKPQIENPKDHEELGKIFDLIDFDAGAKVSGAKFYYLKNEAVMLEFALIHYVLNILQSEGFKLMITPQIVKNEVLDGIGYAPKGPEKQVYGLDEEGLSLIGTAEVTLGGYHKDEILPLEKLPIKYAGFSTCFRTEVGAYGKHSKGLYRVHQFDKVEMFIYCLPEDSEKMHEYLLSLEEKIFQGLNIPYRVIDTATGDLGAPAFRKFDLEAWMPGRGDYGEITSTSNTTLYQAARLNERFEKEGKKAYIHTLNGTAVAISRAMIALLENNQQDGVIKVPEVLVPLTGFSEIKVK